MDIKRLEGLHGRLDEFVSEFDECMKTAPSRRHLSTYLSGQLGPLKRKNVEAIALDADVPPRSLQEFLEFYRWDEKKVSSRIQELVMERHADAASIAVIDETGFPKKGKKTSGVQRQWCGQTGKRDNCVVTVHVGYTAGDFHTLVDCDLFLPEHTWAGDPERRKEAGIPEDVTYRPKWRIALDLLARTIDNGVRYKYATADELYGRCAEFRHELADMGLLYVVEIPCNLTGWTAAGVDRGEEAGRVDRLLKSGRSKWKAFHIKNTEKGPAVWEARAVRFHPHEDEAVGEQQWLVVARNPLKDETKYFLSNAPKGTRVEKPLHIAFSRWHVEKLFKEGKDEIGMKHFEVRKYKPLMRHLVLSMASLLFLNEEVAGLRGGKPMVEHLPGEKSGRGAA